MKWLAFDPVTVLSCLENLRDSVTDEKKPPWPGDFVVSLVAALSIAPMGVTTQTACPDPSPEKRKSDILVTWGGAYGVKNDILLPGFEFSDDFDCCTVWFTKT